MNLTLKNKRFLIIWICVNAFALFVNVAKIEGDITSDKPLGNQGVHIITHYHLLTTIDNIFSNDKFWPFTTFYKGDSEDGLLLLRNSGTTGDKLLFYGIFNSYNFPAFLFYSLLGIAIVYIPK